MDKLSGNALLNSLPESIATDKQVCNICHAIAEKLWNIKKQSELLLLLPRLDELNEQLIDELAWEYHVDFYKPDLSLSEKRKLVRQAIAWHRIKGTPAAVEEVCTAVFQSAQVSEWFEYGGKPYHFSVRLIEEPVPDQRVLNDLFYAIEQTKNTRSWLDGLSFFREILGTFYIGAMVCPYKKVSIYPSKFSIPDIRNHQYFGGAYYRSRKVEIK